MTADNTLATGRHYYLPLDKRGAQYVAAPARWDESLIEIDDLIDEIETRYRSVDAVVSIDGFFYTTLIYVQAEADERAYVVVTSDRRPVTRQPATETNNDDIAAYLTTINNFVEHTESYPTQCGEYVRHVFVPPHIVDSDALQSRRGRRPQRLLWDDVAHYSRVVLLGDPGIGKTTCLRALAVASIDEYHQKQFSRIPVYIALRDFGLNDDLRARCDFALAETRGYDLDFEKLAPSGRVLVLLDGLDEMPVDVRERFLAQVLHLTQRYETVNIVISSRPSSYRGELTNFRHFQIEPFDDQQIQQWIEWKHDPQETWRSSSKLWDFIASDPHIHEIVRTPLLLAIAAFLYRQDGSMPSGRTRMLNRFVEALAGFWDEIRGIKRASHHGINREVRLKHLQHAAFMCRTNDEETFDTTDYVEWQKQLVTRLDARTLLVDIADNTGLWTAHAEDRWGFRHRIIQDFLAARHLVESTEDVFDTSEDKLERRDWSDIWSFVASLTPDASRLVQTICDKAEIDGQSRMRLLTSVLTTEISVSLTTFGVAALRLSSLLSDFFKRYFVAEASFDTTHGWRIVFQFEPDARDMDIASIADTVTSLLKGDSSRQRLLLSDVFGASDDEYVRHLARGMRGSGPVFQNMQWSPMQLVVGRRLP